ncbi:MAG: hypothetical protein JST81_01050 [Bacteroidetes bacterium]|nr:hypothetical protein [Bacteroidota bacterium]
MHTFGYLRWIACVVAGAFTVLQSNAQSDCIFKDTIFSINFGNEQNNARINLNALRNYRQSNSTCPDDGYFSFVPQTSECFRGDWITMKEDHTPGDVAGKMMLVNASERASDFFMMSFEGFKPATNYEFGAWMINVCKLNSGCSPLPPNIRIVIRTATGGLLADFTTGTLQQSDHPSWKKYYGMFRTPDEPMIIKLVMTNTTNGGCGNDFAVDDITFRECYPPPPPVVEKPVVNTPVKKEVPKTIEPIVQKTETLTKSTQKEVKPVETVKPTSTGSPQIKTIKPVVLNIPVPLSTRENYLVQKIKTAEEEILVELYDNGEIDGDTISIYHNNELIVSHQALSAKPIRFHIKVDKKQPHHELIMVADNLGSIPPNTSLMIVTTKTKRYEVFISSSEQKNAKVIFEEKD